MSCDDDFISRLISSAASWINKDNVYCYDHRLYSEFTAVSLLVSLEPSAMDLDPGDRFIKVESQTLRSRHAKLANIYISSVLPNLSGQMKRLLRMPLSWRRKRRRRVAAHALSARLFT